MVRRWRSTANFSSSLAAVLCISASPPRSADAFSPAYRIQSFHGRPRNHVSSLPHRRTFSLHQSKIIDAEVIPDDEISDDDVGNDEVTMNRDMTLVEYSQNQDPDWKSMPVAFCDSESNTYIDCNLAFYIKDPLGDSGEGAEYALGVPCEVPIVVALELEENDANNGSDEGDGTVVNLSRVIPLDPDGNAEGTNVMRDEEKEEIFQLAARALADEFGPSIRLKRTPRVLTLEGDLDGAIGDWREVLLGGANGGKEKLKIEDALNLLEEDDDEDGDYFDMIMKRDLGEDYMKLVEDDDDDDDDMDEELLKLFDLEELEGDLEELMDDIAAKGEKVKDGSYEELLQRLSPSAALRLLNFLGPGGKEYTILRPLRPVLLVGREDPDDYTRRILLTEDERTEVLPRLERACREELEKAGFFLANSGDES